ncbi:MAG: bifunctional adenosylcobinamide kinase/adenosylcobinamide-phosphate guanylyltransferase, partial [Lachnospiraceae bacterium]|nr:bifunctional adenosylcobinamide kinase/adenosylcobinamide-phosphate guanylyltransferase [Lachnospiraceae bacterium]
MMTLIIGGSGSGKSSYAERCAVSLSQMEEEQKAECRKYYLATMQVFDGDAEGRRKVDRHRQLRWNKGFI